MVGVKETTAYPKASHGTLGLISRPEAEWLRRIPMVLGSGMYAELGTYRGRSACLMLDTIQHMKDTMLVAVDMFDDRAVSPAYCHPNTDKYKLVIDLFESRGLTPFVHVVKLETALAANLFKDETFNFLFIDADHSYEGVSKDFYAWESKMKPEGVIAFHDSMKPGVAKLLSEIKSWKEFDRIEALSVWKRTHGN